VAAFVFSTHVATTIGTGIVQQKFVDTPMILSALLGAILWNLITWYLGLPTSSSHALIGALAGAAIAKAGVGAVVLSGLLTIAAFNHAADMASQNYFAHFDPLGFAVLLFCFGLVAVRFGQGFIDKPLFIVFYRKRIGRLNRGRCKKLFLQVGNFYLPSPF